MVEILDIAVRSAESPFILRRKPRSPVTMPRCRRNSARTRRHPVVREQFDCQSIATAITAGRKGQGRHFDGHIRSANICS
jgi:hypothetical protein